MSTTAIGSSSLGTAESHPWWRRALVPLGVGLAVVAPLAMWWRRRHHHNGD